MGNPMLSMLKRTQTQMKKEEAEQAANKPQSKGLCSCLTRSKAKSDVIEIDESQYHAYEPFTEGL
jgi:hypothetical protein